MSEPIRLSKRVVELLGCSRREAELYIEGGWVTVAGEVVEQPQFKVTDEPIVLLPGAEAEDVPPATLLLHKPAGCSVEQALALLTRENRWADDDPTLRAVHKHLVRQQPVGLLEREANGLLVFTQSWGVTRHLTNRHKPLEEEYVAEVKGTLVDGGLERLKRGICQGERTLPTCKASWQNETHLRLALKAPQPGDIRTLCRLVGLQLVSLRRIRLGTVSMAKLPQGQWRYLKPNERF